MAIALLATILDPRVSNVFVIIIAMVIGSGIGLRLANKVEMTEMPELVAILHSFVGLAAVLVGFNSYFDAGHAEVVTAAQHTAMKIHLAEVFIGIFIGAVTFTGSIVAFAKLRGIINTSALMLPHRHKMNLAAGVLSFLMLLTFGTAWVYRNKETNQVVANCYKLPNSYFTKELLAITEIVEEISSSIEKLKSVNPSVKIITTISPVRHWKDGVVENQQSKATLHLALKGINEKFDNSVYFPSYEIVLDELRDYRFYANDMLHPSELAVDYIWEKFSNSFFSKETKELNKRITQLNKEKNHKPFNPGSDEFIAFSRQLVEKENKLYSDYPFLKVR